MTVACARFIGGIFVVVVLFVSLCLLLFGVIVLNLVFVCLLLVVLALR